MRFQLNFSYLINGLRLWGLRPAQLSLEPAGMLASVIPIGLLFLIALVFDWFLVSTTRRNLNWGELERLAAELAVLAIVAWVVSRRLQNTVVDGFGQVFATLTSALLVFKLLAYWVLLVLPREGSWEWVTLAFEVAVLLWFAAAVFVAVRRWIADLEPIPHSRSGQVMLASVPLIIYLLGSYSMPSPGFGFWYPVNERTDNRSLAEEATLNEQARLLHEQVSALSPHRKGITDVYFVGFAPDATEEVFKRELDVIMPLMDERFDTRGRSIRLQSHPSTLRSFPVATQTYLEYTLKHIGQLIDPEEDVVVLYLTSHGSSTFELIPKFPPMKLTPLTPTSLVSILDKSGIKYRAVLVSACYSGGYIRPLRGDNSLVMTASASDRTSFGCGNESEFTYFGKAVLDEQLRSTRDFELAFERALPVILEREEKAGATPSQPQIAVGEGFRARWKSVVSRLGP